MKQRIITLILTALFLFTTDILALSETYQPIRVEIGSIFPIAFGAPVQKGFGGTVEPKLNLLSNCEYK